MPLQRVWQTFPVSRQAVAMILHFHPSQRIFDLVQIALYLNVIFICRTAATGCFRKLIHQILSAIVIVWFKFLGVVESTASAAVIVRLDWGEVSVVGRKIKFRAMWAT